MEHLPRRNGQEKSIFPAIPYLCQEKYDEGHFLDYPRRSGMPNLEHAMRFKQVPTLGFASHQLLASKSPAVLEPFLQNWLFFGLLHEVLGDLYRHEDFVTTSSDGGIEKSIITTADLVSRLEKWEAKVAQDQGSLGVVFEHIANCLTLTYACLLAIKDSAVDDSLKFHLASVAELMGYAARKACNVAWTDTNDPGQFPLPMRWAPTISDHFRKSVLLEKSTCCPSQMQMILHNFQSLQALGFIASSFYEDDVQTYHASCDENNCRAGDLVTPGRVTRHVSDSCDCEFIHTDEKKLVDCLKKKCLPLLRLRKGSNLDEMSVEIVPSTAFTSYVALSHVWADGLGNYKATALPRCQLSRLKVLIDNLRHEYYRDMDHPEDAPEMLLWCDTLCCPVASPEGKNMALKQMGRTYKDASVVLVLDRGLVKNRVGGMSVDEECLRIATSRWMTRLWTLQEGALAARTDRLWFQFTERAVPSQILYKHLWKVRKTDIRLRGVEDSVIWRFLTFMTLFGVQRSENQAAQLVNVMLGLTYRSVTVPSDEPVIIATLLDFDLTKILESERVEERMKVFWGIIGTPPHGIDKLILFHTAPKLNERGFRWALRSLLSVDSDSAPRNDVERKNRGFLPTNRNAKGLVVELAGFRISIAKPAKGLPKHLAGFNTKPSHHIDRHMLSLKDSQGRWYILVHRLLHKNIDRRPNPLEEMCAVISELSSPWVLYDGSSSPVPEDTITHRSLLVEAEARNEEQSQKNEFTCAEIKSQVAFCHVDTGANQICQAAYHLTQELALSAASRRWEELAPGSIDPEDPVYKQVLQGVDLELQRLSESPFAMEALAASGNSADQQGSAKIAENMKRFYTGQYFQIEEYVPGDRKWCVD